MFAYCVNISGKSDLGCVCFTTGTIKAGGMGLCQWCMRYERKHAREMNGQFVNIISTMSSHKTSHIPWFVVILREKKGQLIIEQHHKPSIDTSVVKVQSILNGISLKHQVIILKLYCHVCIAHGLYESMPISSQTVGGQSMPNVIQ